MSSRPHTDKIEAFLTGRMPPEESRSFEQALAQDEDLAIEVEMQRLEHDAMELILEKDLKSKMAKWKDNPPPNPFSEPPAPLPIPQPSTGSWKRWLPLLGAAVFVLGGVYFFLWSEDNTPVSPTAPANAPFDPMKEQNPVVSNEPTKEEQPVAKPTAPQKPPNSKEPTSQKESAYLALAFNEYETPSFDSGQRGSDTEKSVVEEAEIAFNARQYTKTIELLSKPEAGNESQVRYLRGHAYFKLKKYQKAATEFELVAANGFAPNNQDAKWYLMLAYLAQAPAERTNFLKMAEEIADAQNQHARQAEAAKLLEQFNQLK